MSDSSSSSSLTRYTPAIYAFAGAAAAGSAFYLYSAYCANNAALSAGGSLQRSNAVHRRRPREHRAANGPAASDLATGMRQIDGQPEDTPARLDDAVTELGLAENAVEDYGALERPEDNSPEGQRLHQLLFSISKNRAKNEGIVHRGITCDSCNRTPIVGVRYRCMNCPDFDLCEDCEAADIHLKTHTFYKIKVPAPWAGKYPQPVWYPGRPSEMPSQLSQLTKVSIDEETHMGQNRIEGLYQQFSCIANTPWPEDPRALGMAIDRSTFNTCFVPSPSCNARMNLVFDRIYHVFDRDCDGLIGFDDFVHGMTVVVDRQSGDSQRHIFNALDLDGDGHASRKDFQIFFRAFFELEKILFSDHYRMLATGDPAEEVVDSRAPQDYILTGRPLTAYFENMHPDFYHNRRIHQGKVRDNHGDWIPADEENHLVSPPSDGLDREKIIGGRWLFHSTRVREWSAEIERVLDGRPGLYLAHDPDFADGTPEVLVRKVTAPVDTHDIILHVDVAYLFFMAHESGRENVLKAVFIIVSPTSQTTVKEQHKLPAAQRNKQLLSDIVEQARVRLEWHTLARREQTAERKERRRKKYSNYYQPQDPDPQTLGAFSQDESHSFSPATADDRADLQPFGLQPDFMAGDENQRLCLPTESEAIRSVEFVVEEALQELLDPLFGPSEALAMAIMESQWTRAKFSLELRAYSDAITSLALGPDQPPIGSFSEDIGEQMSRADDDRAPFVSLEQRASPNPSEEDGIQDQVFERVMAARAGAGKTNLDDVVEGDLVFDTHELVRDSDEVVASVLSHIDRVTAGVPYAETAETRAQRTNGSVRDPTMPQNMPNRSAADSRPASAERLLKGTKSAGVMDKQRRFRAMMATLYRYEQELKKGHFVLAGHVDFDTFAHRLRQRDDEGRLFLEWVCSWINMVVF